MKNGIKSRKLTNYPGHSIKPENYCLLKHLGTQSELIDMASKMPKISQYERRKPITKKLNDYQTYRDFNICFNLSNEIWWAYNLPSIADKSTEFKDFTSWKLKDKVLYFENDSKRYEISRNILDHMNDDYLFDEFETFRFSEVLEPIEKDNFFMFDNIVPLEQNYLKVMFDRLDWYDFHWGEDSLKVKNELMISNIKSFQFYPTIDSKKNTNNTAK